MDAVFDFLTKQIYEHVKIIFGADRNTLSHIKSTDYVTGLAILFRYVNSRVVSGEKFGSVQKSVGSPKISRSI